MSCPNRCSNDFKVKNFPDEIECVVADTIKTPGGLPATLLVNGLAELGSGVGDIGVSGSDLSGEIAASGSVPGSKNVTIN